MRRFKIWLRRASAEPRLFLGYAAVVFRPGASPPGHPQPPPLEVTPPPSWTDDDYRVYIDEARRSLDDQQRAKEDIRARAQHVFTTALVLGGAMAAAYSHHEHHPVGTRIAYLVAAALTLLTGLAAAGVITAKSVVGGPNIHTLPNTPSGDVARKLAAGYATSRYAGAATVAVLVTVLRDCVLVLVLAFLAFAGAYLTNGESKVPSTTRPPVPAPTSTATATPSAPPSPK
jgi:hypothetical protein